jgi:hypothetical protein
MFEPINPLEALMQAAAADAKRIPDFYRALLDSEIYILTPEAKLEPGRRRSLKLDEKINVATVEFKGQRWHPAFTASKRISNYLAEPETCLGAKARNIFEMLPPGSNFGLNPRSECQKPLPGDEVSLLLSGKIFAMDFAAPAANHEAPDLRKTGSGGQLAGVSAKPAAEVASARLSAR